MRRLTLVLTVILLFSCGSDNDSSLTQKIRGEGNRSLILTAGPEQVWVGVPFKVDLIMKGEEEDDVLFPKVEQDFLPEGLILKECSADDNQLSLIVTAEKAGTYALPPLSVLFDNQAGGVELLTRPVEIEVTSLIQEGETELAPPAPSLAIGFLTRGQSILCLAFLLLLGLFLFWLLFWRKRKKILPPEPIWVTLEREKAAFLEDEGLLDRDRAVFYDGAVSLVKKALDGVYDENTGDRTREEFMEGLIRSPRYDSERKAWFVKFFERADMVRFARIEVDRESCVNDLDETLRFVSGAAKKAKAEGEDRP
ncbi:MAG: hypothetical protein PQJ60_03225 [Spirochaetales bacterium]|nr:hypothetical protein [Spirochaetales bacterium]